MICPRCGIGEATAADAFSSVAICVVCVEERADRRGDGTRTVLAQSWWADDGRRVGGGLGTVIRGATTPWNWASR